MADTSRVTQAFGCVVMLAPFLLCGGCLYSCLSAARRHHEVDRKRIETEEALIKEYAPQLRPAISDCEEQIRAWSDDLATLSQTIRRVGKDPGKDKDVQEAAKVIEELTQVRAKLLEARADLLIALTKTQVKTGKGSQEERLRRAQMLVGQAVSQSEKAVRIAKARQRQIDGDIDRGELAGGESDQDLGRQRISVADGMQTNDAKQTKDGERAANGETERDATPTSPDVVTPKSEPTTVPSLVDLPPKPTTSADAPPAPKPTRRNQDPPKEQINVVGQRLKLIPAGQFEMGAEPTEIDGLLANTRQISEKAKERLRSEQPQHRVELRHAYYLGVTEVTVGQFKAFVDETSYVTTAESQSSSRTWRRVGYTQADNHPVTAVSWDDAAAFCQWLSQKEQAVYRLPTEAEWEYACRAGRNSSWFWGGTAEKLGEYAWSDRDSNDKLQPVATKSPNKFGLFDMQGNVSEWCQDWYAAGYYASSPIHDPTGPESGAERVIRGGSILHQLPAFFRSTLRGGLKPDGQLVGIGFRVLREVDPPNEP
jgi:formylglycine-generating enzyme required for sulfatase activity